MEPPPMTFASQLKKWRGVTGRGKGARGKFSQEIAAQRLGVPPRTYEDWEAGRHQPQGLALEAIKEKLLRERRARKFASDVLADISKKFKLPAEKKAGRRSAPSNRKTKRTRPARRTGSKRVTNENKKSIWKPIVDHTRA